MARIDRGLKPRKRDDYNNEVDGRRPSGKPPDDMTTNKKMQINIVRPPHKEGPLYYLAFPQLDPDNPKERLVPGRTSSADRAQSTWIMRIPVAKYVGKDRQATFLPARAKQKSVLDNSPYAKFTKSCHDAGDSGFFGNGRKWDSSWNSLLKGTSKGGEAIPKIKYIWVQQGAIFQSGERTYMDRDSGKPLGLARDDDLTIIQLSENCGSGLLKLLDTKNKDFDGDPDGGTANLRAAFKYHAIGKISYKERSITGGRVLLAYNPKNTKIKGATSWDGNPPRQGSPWAYEAAVRKEYIFDRTKYNADLVGDDFDEVFNKSMWWWDDEESGQEGCLHVAPYEEQADLIAECFASIPKLILFGLPEEFHTDSVKGIIRKRVTSVSLRTADDDEDEDENVNVEEEDEDEETPRKKQPKKAAAKNGDLYDNYKSKKKVDEDEDEEEEASEEDEDEEVSEGDEDEEASEEDEDEEEVSEDDEDEEEAAGEDEDEEEAGGEDEDEEEASGEDEDEEESGEDDEDEEEASEDEDEDEEEASAEDDEDEEPAPAKKTSAKKTAAKTAANANDEEYFPEDENSGEKKTAKKTAAKEKPKKPVQKEMFEEDDLAAKKEAEMKKSMNAAREAGERSAARKTPAKEPPVPAASGGKATRKKKAAKKAAKK